ncbi:MAG TPA: ATP synthase subunit I [Gammaproteobacteria bacterium]|nr:ATP synthase subunit I [Gammaproteobacteria bacterium]
MCQERKLSETKSKVVTNTRRLITGQFLIGLLVAAVFFIAGTNWQGVSAVYGFMTTILVSAYLGYGVVKAEKVAQSDPKKSLGILYFGAAQRFIMVAGLFVIGLAALKLDPLATAAGFGFSQLGYVINLRQQARVN